MSPRIRIRATCDPARACQALQRPAAFGSAFADLMVTMFHDGVAWHDAAVVPFGPVHLSPAAKVLHYGVEIFEGLKAHRQPDGGVALFRPELNCRRLNRSAARVRLPEIPETTQMAVLETFVDAVRCWVPDTPGHALYLRPALIGTESALGIGPSAEHLFFIVAAPVGRYFSAEGSISVRVEEEHVRAVAGGVGAAKTGGNYAAGLDAQERAREAGFDQVLWLDALERRYVEELSGMNVFAVLDSRLVTPPADGTILEGITRRSIMELAPGLGIVTEERRLPIEELVAGMRTGQVSEIFAAGTAAAVTAVGTLGVGDDRLTVGNGEEGPVTRRIRETLVGIQEGRLPDTHGWLHAVVPAHAALRRGADNVLAADVFDTGGGARR